jgi:hypothetical protein
MVMTREAMPEVPQTACQCGDPWNAHGCMCEDEEKFLRAGGPFTPAQREWCLSEIAAVEGYSRADHETENDAQLGRTVLSAWRDYCRDKGLM